MRFVAAFACAQDQPDGWVLAGLRPVLAGVVQIHVHLPRIGMAELPHLEVDDQQALQAAVKEQEVDTKPAVVQPQAALAAHEGEIVAQLQQKIGQMLDECVFQVGFRIFVLETQELQHERVFDGLLGREGVAGFGNLGLSQHGGLVARQGDALVELAVHLPVELAHRPAAAQRFGFVEGAGLRVFDREQAHVG